MDDFEEFERCERCSDGHCPSTPFIAAGHKICGPCAHELVRGKCQWCGQYQASHYGLYAGTERAPFCIDCLCADGYGYAVPPKIGNWWAVAERIRIVEPERPD